MTAFISRVTSMTILPENETIYSEQATVISIEDEGVGLTLEEQKQLFKPFTIIQRNQSLNSNGSGLGLIIIKETLEQLNSKIQFTSQAQKGSCFYFDIPFEFEAKDIGSFKLNELNKSPDNATSNYLKSDSADTKSLDQFYFLNNSIKKVISQLEKHNLGKIIIINKS